MNISGDIQLRHSLWKDAQERYLKDFIFERLVDLFIVACSIGIKEDKIIENDLTSDDDCVSIGRNTYLVKNEDLSTIITFLFQNAVLNSKHINFDSNTRLRIAFDPDFPDANTKINLSPTSFLVKFATYGLSVLNDKYNSNDLAHVISIKDLLDEHIMEDYSDILEEIKKDMEEFSQK